MTNNWPGILLSESGDLRNGVNFSQAQEGSGIPIIKVKDFRDRFFAPIRGLDELSARATSIPEDQMLQPGDTIIIRSNGNPSLVGRCLYVQELKRPTTFSGFCIRFRPNRSVLEPRFASYLLRSPLSRRHFVSHGTGTGIQNLNQKTISSLALHLPSIEEQRAINRVLGGLDDKIELNLQMNQALESLAQAIFRSWFVDFDPVVAKADGREPFGMVAEIADLFPERFVDSEIGPIPEGWQCSTVGREARVVGGSTPSSEEPEFWNHGQIPWATPRDLADANELVLLATRRKITERGLAKISSGLLPAGTVLLSSRAPIGYLAIAEIPLAVNQGFIAMISRERIGHHFLLQWARENMQEILSRAGGTTFPEISKSSFRPIPILVPRDDIHEIWNRIAHDLHEKVADNLHESLTLAELRDLLLPKLLSGEIRLRQAEKAVEQVL